MDVTNDLTTTALVSSPPGVPGDGGPHPAPPGPVHRDEVVERPGQRGGGLGPSTGADVLAGVPRSRRATLPSPDEVYATTHGNDDEDVYRGVPGRCWVCQRDFEFSVTDFGPDGAHAICASKARRMKAGFEAALRLRYGRTIPVDGPVDWNAVQW